jgi:hypothetical protein
LFIADVPTDKNVHQIGPDDVLIILVGGCYTMSFPIALINLIVAEAIGQP